MSPEKPRKNQTGSDRARAKSAPSTSKTPAREKPVTKSKSTARAKSVNPSGKSPSRSRASRSTALRPAISDAERDQRISEAAYFRAEKRGFTPGAELDDWFSAETEINQILRNTGY